MPTFQPPRDPKNDARSRRAGQGLAALVSESARGALPFRGSEGLDMLDAGAAGEFLMAGGPGADPSWQDFGDLTTVDPALADEIPLADASAAYANRNTTIERLLGFGLHAIALGRLTLETGVAVSTTDQTSKGTLYWTPHNGNRVSLYDGTRWKLYTFAEVSLALTVTSAKNYDVFLFDNAGTLTLELSAAWTNDTTRADALALQDGVQVKNGATTRRWLGTLRASGANVTEDSRQKRFLWNAYNRLPRALFWRDTTSSWNYTTATWRQSRASAANQVEVVCGAAGHSLIDLIFSQCSSNSTAAVPRLSGIGEDSTTTGAADMTNGQVGGPVGDTFEAVAHLRKFAPLGYHFYTMLEFSSATGTSTFYGNTLHGLAGHYDT